MRHLLALACLALPLGACAYDDYGYGPRYGAPLAYDGYYDNYYGPIYDGYWGGGGVFYYRNRGSGRWRADRGGHFRRDVGPGGPGGGFRAFHGNGPGLRAGGPGFRGGAGFRGGRGGGPHGHR